MYEKYVHRKLSLRFRFSFQNYGVLDAYTEREFSWLRLTEVKKDSDKLSLVWRKGYLVHFRERYKSRISEGEHAS